MLYRCKTIPLLQLPKGLKEPLCDTCLSKDCDHPVEKRIVALPSGNKDWRVMSRGIDISLVVACEGFQSRRTPPEKSYIPPEEQANK